MDPSLVWTPDVVLYNNGDSDLGGGVDKYTTLIEMRFDGRHSWGAPTTFTSSCRVNTKFYPFDVQECALKFGSWTQNSHKLVLEADNEQKLLGANFIPSSEWNIEEVKTRVHSVCYSDTIPYDDVTFTLKISREGLSYVFFMVTPCLIVVFTTLFSFSLPPESGERLIVIVTNLLCFALFLFMTSESLPNNSDAVAIISVFYLVFMVESSLSVFVACYVLTVYYRGRQPDPPQIPHWLKIIFLHIYKRIYNVTDKLSSPSTQIRRPVYTSLAPILANVMKEVSTTSDTPVESEPAHTEEQAPVEVRFADRKRSQRSLSMQLYRQPSQMNHSAQGTTKNNNEEEEVTGEILKEMQFITAMDEERNRREALRLDWEVIGYMLDRLYFWVFLVMVIFTALYILGLAYISKQIIVNDDGEVDGHVESVKIVKGCH